MSRPPRRLWGMPQLCLLSWAFLLLACLSVVAADPAVSVPPAAGTELTPSMLLDELQQTAKAKQARLTQLRQQMQRLREESRRAKSEPDSSAVPPPADHEAAPPEPVESTPPAPHAEPGNLLPPGAEALLGGEHDLTTATEPIAPHAVQAPSEHGVEGEHASEIVVGTSINRLSLGDSLFATGQTELALQAYDAIDAVKLPTTERYWVQYQLANCHRRLGNIPEAEQRYRRLAELVDGGWCAAHARWWLDALETRTEMQRDLNAIRETLKTVEEQLNAAATR
ncbi:MAG: hypothetical protein U0992_10755 [Planctomycetaceae bacterium]